MALNRIIQFTRSTIGLGRPEAPRAIKFPTIGAYFDELRSADSLSREDGGLAWGAAKMDDTILNRVSDLRANGKMDAYDGLMAVNAELVFANKDRQGIPDDALNAIAGHIKGTHNTPADHLAEVMIEEAQPKSLVERFKSAVMGEQKYEFPFSNRSEYLKQLNRSADVMKAGHTENGEIMMQDTLVHAVRARHADGVSWKQAFDDVDYNLRLGLQNKERVPREALTSLQKLADEMMIPIGIPSPKRTLEATRA